jgi:hypothetical protein
MGKPGTLTKDKFGNSMPVNAPLYGRLPVLYKGVSMLIYNYVTDPDAAAALLPAQLELRDGPTVVTMLFAEYQWSSLGPYNEIAQTIECVYKGMPMKYTTLLHVTNDTALTMGRECGGIPKKMGHIPFGRDPNYWCRLERPLGVPICSAVMQQTVKVGAAPPPLEFVSLRLIPNIQTPETPSLRQLMQTTWVFLNGELWAAQGSFSFAGVNDLDPYYKLPVKEVAPPVLYLGEMQVAKEAKVLENF